jgi:hypothetical protein
MSGMDQLAVLCFIVAAVMFLASAIESTSLGGPEPPEPHRWLVPAGLAFIAIGLALLQFD